MAVLADVPFVLIESNPQERNLYVNPTTIITQLLTLGPLSTGRQNIPYLCLAILSMSSISVPSSGYYTSYSNNQVTEPGDVINGDDAFHVAEDDDDISLEGLDDDDDISTSDASTCIVCRHPCLRLQMQ